MTHGCPNTSIMKVGYSTAGQLPQHQDAHHHGNISSNAWSDPSPVEGAALFCIAVLGALGNTFVMVVTLTCPKFRQMSSAFLFHHCLLDAVKSVFCLPFGYSLLLRHQIPRCDVVGAAYILLMTVSAYNLLAMLVNEEYQCAFVTKNSNGLVEGKMAGDCCCIAFGVVIIWFTTILLHLGVAFLPGSSEFSRDIGTCVYLYGVTKNYVIHALWVILVTGAIVVAAISFFHFYRKLQTTIKTRTWTSVHKSLSSLNHHALQTTSTREETHYDFEDADTRAAILQTYQYMRRLIVLLFMVISFVVCWYPLFLLTLIDIHYQQPARLYRGLTIVAWTHPLTTPIFCAVIYYNQGRGVYKATYANAIPLTTSRSSHTSGGGGGGGGELEGDGDNPLNVDGTLTFLNHNFQWGSNYNDVCTSRRVTSPNSSQDALATSPNTAHDVPATPPTQCDTITNYNVEEDACHTLIM